MNQASHHRKKPQRRRALLLDFESLGCADAADLEWQREVECVDVLYLEYIDVVGVAYQRESFLGTVSPVALRLSVPAAVYQRALNGFLSNRKT